MKTLVMALGLFVLGPSTVFALSPQAVFPIPGKREAACIDPRKDTVQAVFPVDTIRKQPKIKKRKTPKPVRMPDPTPAEVKAFVQSISAVDWALVLAVVQTESSFHSMALAHGGGSGHYGVMQIAPGTARAMGFRGKTTDLYDWRVNVRYGMRYLAYLQNLHGTLTDAAIASYNSGTPHYHRVKGKPPVLKNHGYVSQVRRYYAIFKRLD